jgi:hypothetical protein
MREDSGHGTHHELAGKVYVPIPNLTLTIGMYPHELLSGVKGVRHHGIAIVRGLYHAEGRALGIREIHTFGRLDCHGKRPGAPESFPSDRQLDSAMHDLPTAGGVVALWRALLLGDSRR